MFGDEVPAFIADKRAVDDVEWVVTQGALLHSRYEPPGPFLCRFPLLS